MVEACKVVPADLGLRYDEGSFGEKRAALTQYRVACQFFAHGAHDQVEVLYLRGPRRYYGVSGITLISLYKGPVLGNKIMKWRALAQADALKVRRRPDDSECDLRKMSPSGSSVPGLSFEPGPLGTAGAGLSASPLLRKAAAATFHSELGFGTSPGCSGVVLVTFGVTPRLELGRI